MQKYFDWLSSTLLAIHNGTTNIADIDFSSGAVNIRVGTLQIGGYAIPTGDKISLLAQGVAAGYKIARSAAPVALDGSNPTSVAHGLTTCIAAFAQLSGSGAPGAGTSVLSCVINGANIDVYGWMPTGAALTGLIASTNTESFHWFAIGV